MQLRQIRAEPSHAPTVKSRNSAYNYTRTLTAHCRGRALLHPKSLAGSQGLSGRAMLAPTIESQKSDIFFEKTLPFARRGLHRRPAEGAACFWYSRSPPIRAKTFSYSKKKTRKRNRSQVFHLGAPSAGAFRKQCSALFLATEFPRANQHRTVVLVAACGRPPCSRPWCKPKKSPRS